MLLKELVASLSAKSFGNQLAASALPTCNRLVVNKMNPGICLLITSGCIGCQQTCCNLHIFSHVLCDAFGVKCP